MPCDTQRNPNQSISQRAEEIRATVLTLERLLLTRKVRPVVGAQGAITFSGWTENRNGITDACAYRRIMATGSAIAKQEIARAEQLSGTSVSRRVVNAGIHSHDGGHTWHGKG